MPHRCGSMLVAVLVVPGLVFSRGIVTQLARFDNEVEKLMSGAESLVFGTHLRLSFGSRNAFWATVLADR